MDPIVNIHIDQNVERFTLGDTLTGFAEIKLIDDSKQTLKKDAASVIRVTFHCDAEVKWIEPPTSPQYLQGLIYCETHNFFELSNCSKQKPQIVNEGTKDQENTIRIPFEFVIPNDNLLPSTMISTHGSIEYFIRVTVQPDNIETTTASQPLQYRREIIVEAPMSGPMLATSIGAHTEKNVLLHGAGKVSLFASLDRKAYAQGENIPVHITIVNDCNAPVVPRVSLFQTQIFMCGTRHKTIENTLKQPNESLIVTGKAVESSSEMTNNEQSVQVLQLHVPNNEAFSLKTPLITVKYFVHVTLDIPQSIDLHLNLPVIITSSRVIDSLKSVRQIA